MNKENSVRSLSTLLLLGLCLGWSGCAASRSISTNSNSTNSDLVLVTPIVSNPRFEIQSAQTFRPSIGLWIRGGDNVAVRWHEFSVLTNKANVMCNFGVPNQDCQRCNACSTADTPSFCNWVPYYDGFNPIQLYKFPGFMVQLPPSETTDLSPTNGCETTNGFLLSPTTNAAYQLKLSPEYFNDAPVDKVTSEAEARIHVLAGGKESVQYEISSLIQPGSSATLAFFGGKVPTGDGAELRDNFSNRVSIGKIRVLKGTPHRDPVTGDFSVTNASEVKPSRIVLINNFVPYFDPFEQGTSVFDNDTVRCYAQYTSSTDGDLDLTRCRNANDSSATQNLDATPVYRKSVADELLTWVVEFNQADFAAIGGGEMPVFDPALEVLAIEFTIQ